MSEKLFQITVGQAHRNTVLDEFEAENWFADATQFYAYVYADSADQVQEAFWAKAGGAFCDVVEIKPDDPIDFDPDDEIF